MNNKDVVKLIKDEEADYVDIRFTDPRGKLQHVTIVADLVDEDFLEEGFMFDVDSYERQGNGKGDMVNRGRKKILNIKYTPDFVSDSFIIECKGRANESFPLRWKMFKKHVKEHIPHVTLYKPQNQKECDKVVELIKNKNK